MDILYKRMDLNDTKYDRETLKKNIYLFNLCDILKTQTIDVTFAVKYLLNPKYQLTEDEQKITPKMILFYQPHISKFELLDQLLSYDSDDDSIDDFETVSTR
jgi:hypothetical protein